ncbi:hypothetical protein [Candidatus Cyanaurora vandensis]|uniref:hypothetical protein n=1 Tax=Candidatus Cyanaurora vandensis TaxID=2714958 RepID=UPI0037BF9F3C
MVASSSLDPLRNPDVQDPVLWSDEDGRYLEMRVDADPLDPTEIAVTRRIPLDSLKAEEWAELKCQYDQLNLKSYTEQGIAQGLEKIKDRRIQRMFLALFTFLNPRQVGIVLFLYREAAHQGTGPEVYFRSNDLLASLGYSRTRDGGFPSKLRSQLNRDLVALHRTELVFARSLKRGNKVGADVVVKSILRIKRYQIDNVPRDFDLMKAADYTYELADAYTVNLEFFEGPGRTGDYVLFADSIGIKQSLGNGTKSDYRLKLIVYLASRMKWDALRDGQYLVVSRHYLLKNLDLLGSNSTRNTDIFWRTVDQLKTGGYLLDAKELPGKKNVSIEFQINPLKLRNHEQDMPLTTPLTDEEGQPID